MKKKRVLRFIPVRCPPLAMLAAVLICVAAPCMANEQIVGTVVDVEGSFMPARIKIKLDQSSATCPSGVPLTWASTNYDNNKAVYSGLLAALANSRKIVFVIADADTTCTGVGIHFQ
ncbi:hypothetical protein [Hydrocarboniphaga sp.]|uniref:hypothetical protein n=1 Tax=Hydrocarboniphaga sp. TaxID=2033016 RepID=UPI003D114746